ncbi:twin-arginine translocase TatA/TatE family subunit [bacterium]|nr:twin-arginine translocase TatA/TatE family subunit [bacterium]
MVALIDIGGSELLLILGAALVLLGPRRLPEIARQIGQINNKLRDANRELKRELYSNLEPPATPTAERPLAGARHRESGLPLPPPPAAAEAPYRDAEAELARVRAEAAAGPAAEAAPTGAQAQPSANEEADPGAAGSASPGEGPRGG